MLEAGFKGVIELVKSCEIDMLMPEKIRNTLSIAFSSQGPVPV